MISVRLGSHNRKNSPSFGKTLFTPIGKNHTKHLNLLTTKKYVVFLAILSGNIKEDKRGQKSLSSQTLQTNINAGMAD